MRILEGNGVVHVFGERKVLPSGRREEYYLRSYDKNVLARELARLGPVNFAARYGFEWSPAGGRRTDAAQN